MSHKPENVVDDLATIARGAGIEQSALEAFVKACEAGDWDAAERHRQDAHDALDAVMDAIAAGHRLLHGLGGK